MTAEGERELKKNKDRIKKKKLKKKGDRRRFVKIFLSPRELRKIEAF